jgi:hypothetical protein
LLFVSGSKNSEECINICEMILHALKSVGFVIEFREAMSWAVDNTEDLRKRDQKVENLREEEKEHGLCEMSQDADHCEGHACKVAESVADENL